MLRIRRRRRPRRAGFTLMEILLVLAILVILGGLVVYNFAGIQTNAYRDAAKNQIAVFKNALEMYRLHTGRYPTGQSGLNALVSAPSDLPNPKKWQGPYLQEGIPLDPWDNQYMYELQGSGYVIRSLGPDGVNGSTDDVTSDLNNS
ncbi:MAG: type II secretion system major pseudopilin GspG [Planctomycetales bacterium]|nr:type II secretion system major pseudopilin GspG [Planctomycetales bacterium]